MVEIGGKSPRFVYHLAAVAAAVPIIMSRGEKMILEFLGHISRNNNNPNEPAQSRSGDRRNLPIC